MNRQQAIELERLDDETKLSLRAVSPGKEPRGHITTALLDECPDAMAELPAFFASIKSREKIETVWVAAVLHCFSMDRGGMTLRSLAAALCAVRDWDRLFNRAVSSSIPSGLSPRQYKAPRRRGILKQRLAPIVDRVEAEVKRCNCEVVLAHQGVDSNDRRDVAELLAERGLAVINRVGKRSGLARGWRAAPAGFDFDAHPSPPLTHTKNTSGLVPFTDSVAAAVAGRRGREKQLNG